MKPYSIHSFMLPMRWDYLPNGFRPSQGRKGEISFDIRTNLGDFLRLLIPGSSGENSQWERKFYRIKKSESNYNELVYYHSHASLNFFDFQHEDEKDGPNCISKNKVCLYFELSNVDKEKGYYRISIRKRQEVEPKELIKDYKLKLNGVSLHVFTTGVCLLTYTMRNEDYPSPEDILMINEFGRRVYPPFMSEVALNDGRKDNLSDTRIKALAESIELSISEDARKIYEDFSRYKDISKGTIETHIGENGKYKYNAVIDFPKIVKELFDAKRFVFTADEEERAECEVISFRLINSDRMFFQSWYGNNTLAQLMSRKVDLVDGKKGYQFAQSAFWYAFMYGDRSEDNLGIGNPILMEEHLLKNTYSRWAQFGTLFGFTNDSFVCISQDINTLFKNDVPNLAQHMQSIYYTMAVLNLVQRASALRFSGEVATLADLGKTDQKLIARRIQDLNLNYIEFINKVYYREISPEIQGIEIYEHLQRAMNIENDVNDLKMEINELHQYVNMVQDKERNENGAILNKIAFVFLPMSLVFGIMGSNFFSDNLSWVPFSGWNQKAAWGILTGFLLSAMLFIILVIWYNWDKIKSKNK